METFSRATAFMMFKIFRINLQLAIADRPFLGVLNIYKLIGS
jgi:hypothetical protein